MHAPQPQSWSQTPRRAGLEVFLLGQVDYAQCLALQQRLVQNCFSRAGGTISLLLCEHPPIITLGRAGSTKDIQLRGALLAGRQLEVLSVARGGGAVLHMPGQLAVYPIVPLEWYRWTVGEFMERFTAGLQAALAGVGIRSQPRPGRHGLWGRTGELVSLGVGIRDWITYHGAQINVLPTPPLGEYLVTDPVEGTPLGSLQREQGRSIAMSQLRSRVARSVAEGFDCEYHLYTGHPLLAHLPRGSRVVARAS